MNSDAGHCLAIGNHASAHGKGCVAIGDNVSVIEDACGNVEVLPKDVLRVGSRMAIGRTIFGEECNLQDLILQFACEYFGVPT